MATKKPKVSGKEVDRGTQAQADDAPVQVRFDYIKSNLCRVVYVDGFFGGPTPDGMITLSAWNQRQPIPKQITHAINETGGLGPQVGRVSRDTDFVREVETVLVLSNKTARGLNQWLEQVLAMQAEIDDGSTPESVDD